MERRCPMTGLHQRDHWLDNLASTSLHQSPCSSFLPVCVFCGFITLRLVFITQPPAASSRQELSKTVCSDIEPLGVGEEESGLWNAPRCCEWVCMHGFVCVCLCPVCVDERLPCQLASDYACCVLSEGKCALSQSAGEPRGFFFCCTPGVFMRAFVTVKSRMIK